jgi:hypothetical protein
MRPILHGRPAHSRKVSPYCNGIVRVQLGETKFVRRLGELKKQLEMVTANVDEFSRVAGLAVENWLLEKADTQ